MRNSYRMCSSDSRLASSLQVKKQVWEERIGPHFFELMPWAKPDNLVENWGNSTTKGGAVLFQS